MMLIPVLCQGRAFDLAAGGLARCIVAKGGK